jgi:ATP-dependent Zn protease
MIILLAVVYTMTTPSTTEKMIYSDVVDLFNKEEVESFVITGSEIVITKRGVDPASPDATVSYELFSVDYFLYQMMDTIDQQHAEGIIKDYDLKTGFVAPWWVSMIPYLLLIGGIVIAAGLVVFLLIRRKVYAGETKAEEHEPGPVEA